MIHVVVPADATPGPIRLSILDHVLRLCGQTFPIYRLGDTLAAFNGGLPRVTSFFLNGVDGDAERRPATKVDLQFTTSTGELTSVDVRVVDPAGAVVFQTVVPGGFHAFSFTAPPVSTGPVDLAVSVAVHGVCGISTRSATLVVTHQPDLRILDVEVTQAIQRLDNTVRLAARRRTMVRLYLGNGLGNHRPFSYTATPSELPGVTGSVTLWRGATRLAVVSPVPAVITSRFFFRPVPDHELSLSLNFDLPVGVLDGPLRIEARVLAGHPPPRRARRPAHERRPVRHRHVRADQPCAHRAGAAAGQLAADGHHADGRRLRRDAAGGTGRACRSPTMAGRSTCRPGRRS